MIKYIALCGYPKAGKNAVQDIISDRYGFAAYDDSLPLRRATMAAYGLSEWHVTTQEGKATLIDVGGRLIPVRTLMGDLGCFFEEKDEFHFPRLARKTCAEQAPDGKFVFASVRRNQPRFFKDAGDSLVIEVTRAGCRPSGEFDEYCREPIDISIDNYRDEANPEASLRALEEKVRLHLDPILNSQLVPA